MNLMNWTPVTELETLMNRVARGALAPQTSESQADLQWRPASAIVENDNEYIISTDVPAVKREDIRVNVEDNVLVIEGERKVEKSAENEKEHRREYYRGAFARRFLLPDDADATGISADCRDGVLKVRIPKTPEERPKTVSVPIN